MRLFTGLDLSNECRQRLEGLLAQLRPLARLKWSPVENLHITAKFIGEWPETGLDDLKRALAGIAARDPIAVAVHGLGWFPNAHSPRVFWAGVEGGDGLRGLARDIDAALEPLGVARETKPYSPHLTLARVKDAAPLAGLRSAIAQLTSEDYGSFVADRFYLYHSKPGPGGSTYLKLAAVPLQHS